MHGLGPHTQRNSAYTLLLFLLLSVGLPAFSQAPLAVFSHSNLVTVTNATFKNGPYPGGTGAGTGHLAANNRGDLFFIDGVFGYPAPAFLVEVPASGGPYIELLTGIGNGARGLAVDTKGNLYVSDNVLKNIYFIPFVNNGYPANIDVSTVAKCKLPVSANTTTCKNPFTLPAAIGYYLISQDITTDALGNAYIVDISDGLSAGAYFRILKASSTTGVLTILVDKLAKATQPQIAADAAGNVYYVDGTNATYYPAGTSTGIAFGSGLSKPNGVGIDGSGNLYIGDTGNSRIVEIPNIGGFRANGNQYILSNQLATTGFGTDGYGTLYYSGANGNAIYRLVTGNLNLGSTTIGKATTTQTLDLYFASPASFGSFTLSSNAGTVPFGIASNGCANGKAYTSGSSCSITIAYTATLAGPQAGTIRAYDLTGNLLAEAALSGVGQAPLLNIDPGIAASIGSGWKTPSAITVDASGNTYVADSTTGTVYKNGSQLLNGFYLPTGIAVDGAGSLYIAESGNQRVTKVPFLNGAFGTSSTLYSGVSGNVGLAIDSGGNVYVADSGNARVLLLSSSGNLPVGSLVTTVGTGFIKPSAVAVDAVGNLYVSDPGAQQVVQVNIPTGLQTSVVTGMTTPAGVAVDPSGSLYAVDSGKQTVVRVPYTGGAINPALQMTLSAAVTNPVAIAVDASGSVYLVDTKAAAVTKVNRTTGSLAFGIIDLAGKSPTLSAVLTDAGSSSLTFSTPYSTATGNSGSFSVQASSTCANGAVLGTGASCNLDEVFTPPGIGVQNAVLTFAATGASGTLALSGTGFRAVVASIAGPTAIVYGTTDVYTVTAAADGIYKVGITGTASASSSVTVTGGTGQFTLPGIGAGAYTISVIGTTASTSVSVSKAPLTVTAANATRTYGAANPVLTASVTGAVNGDVLTATATTAAGLASAVGTYAIVPTASGSGIANYTVTPVNGTLTVTQTATTSAVSSTTPVVYAGTPVTLSATVKSNTTGVPTGTVTFLSNNAVVGSGTLINGVAMYVTSSSLTAALYNITVLYSGDSNFLASTSPLYTITISPPDFSLTSSASSLTVKQGQSATATLTVTGVSGFSQSVVFSCSNLPLEASCAYSPASVNPGSGPVTSQFTISTVGTMARLDRTSPWNEGRGVVLAGLMLFCFAGGRMRRQWKGRLLLALIASLLGITSLSGCGRGTSIGTPVTPLGTSTITVTAQSGPSAIQHPVMITVTVTN